MRRHVFGQGRALQRIGVAARRLADDELDEERHDDARRADDHEGHAPAPGLGQPSAGGGADHAAQRYAEGIDRKGRGAPPRLEIVRDQGMGRRRTSGLAHAHPDAQGQQLGEISGKAAGGRERRPHDHGDGDDRHPVEALGRPGDGDSQQRVEDRERQAAQQAQLGVGQLQVDLDRLADGGDDRAVDEVEGVGQHQQAQHRALVAVGEDRPAAGGRAGLGVGRGRRAHRRAFLTRPGGQEPGPPLRR